MNEFNELDFEIRGTIQVLHDYTLMHLRSRNSVESEGMYQGKLPPFDHLKSLRRIRRQARYLNKLLEMYKI